MNTESIPRELSALLAWGSVHLIVVGFFLFNQQAGLLTADLLMDMGSHDPKKQELAEAPKENDPTSVRMEPRQSESAPTPNDRNSINPVEPAPEQVERLNPEEVDELVEQYCELLSESNVQVKLDVSPANYQLVGTDYAYTLDNGQVRIFNHAGERDRANGNYNLHVSRGDVPTAVVLRARTAIAARSFPYASTRLIIDHRVELQMYRSLHEFLQQSGHTQLQPDSIYVASVTGHPIRFTWRRFPGHSTGGAK